MATIAKNTATTITVWREGQDTRWHRRRFWIRRRLDAIGVFRVRRRFRVGDVIEIVGERE